jgi:SOS-response transcriptional repressor LexA
MTQLDIQEVRRENLRLLINEKFGGVNAAFSRTAGRDPNLINLILTGNLKIRRNMGERLARGMEQDLGLPHGWFDIPRLNEGGAVERITTIPIVRLDALDKPSLEQIVVGQDVIGRNVDSPTSTSALRAVYATDNDMAPAITKGDILIVDTGVTAFVRSGVYVMVRGEDVFVRRITKPITGGIRISADSEPASAFEPQEGQFRCSGRIVGVMRFIEI